MRGALTLGAWSSFRTAKELRASTTAVRVTGLSACARKGCGESVPREVTVIVGQTGSSAAFRDTPASRPMAQAARVSATFSDKMSDFKTQAQVLPSARSLGRPPREHSALTTRVLAGHYGSCAAIRAPWHGACSSDQHGRLACWLVFHNSVTFHSANGMLYPDADGRNATIGRFFRGSEFPSTRFFLGWNIVTPLR